LNVKWRGYRENFFICEENEGHTPPQPTDATIFLHISGAMQFAAVSSWARRFFKSVTMATQAGS